MSDESLTKHLIDRSSTARAILDVINEGEKMRPKEIAELVSSSSNSVSNYLRSFREEGFVEREKNGRSAYYDTTEKAEKFYNLEQEVHQKRKEIRELVGAEASLVFTS